MRGYELPPTREAVDGYIRRTLCAHSEAKSFFMGRSVLGRRIPVLTLGEPVGGALLVGATHGSEWLTALLLLRFFEELADACEHGHTLCGADVAQAVARRGVVVMPVLNPDGVEIALLGTAGAGQLGERVARLASDKTEHWQANARGVDINHNFGAGWAALQRLERESGIFGPAPTRYGGPRPFSEPETRAVCGCCSTFDIRRLYSFHSQGEEIYWRYGPRTPARSFDMASLLAESSGYTLSQPEGMAAAGGLKDWYIEKFGRPGFTIEIGRGKNPLPITMLDEIYDRTKEVLVLTLLL